LDLDLIGDIIVFLDVYNGGYNIGFFDSTIRYNSCREEGELRLTKDFGCVFEGLCYLMIWENEK